MREYVLLGRTPYVSYAGQRGPPRPRGHRAALERLDLVDSPTAARHALAAASASARCSPARSRRRRTCSCSTSRRRALDAGRQQEALELIDALRLDAGLTVVCGDARPDARRAYASRLLLLSGGRIVAAGGAAEVLTEPLIAEHYGAQVRVVEGAVIPVRR